MASHRLGRLLEELAAANVDFILVGGLAAVSQGAPLATFDVDIVHRRSDDNVDRLLDFLARNNARHRGRPRGQILPPQKLALLGPGHSLLMTDLGPLDLLGTIEGGLGYEDLEPDSIVLPVGTQTIRVLRLARLVALKRASNHPKDRQALPILEATLERLESGGEDHD